MSICLVPDNNEHKGTIRGADEDGSNGVGPWNFI